MCVSLTLPRRLALLEWAARADAWIVEDDYDGEYRYVSRPLPALKSLDRQGRVLYAGTFSKVLFPGIRLAYLVVPESLGRTVRDDHPGDCRRQPRVDAIDRRSLYHRRALRTSHPANAQVIWRATRSCYRWPPETVLGEHVHIESPPGGMHVILQLQARQSDREFVARMLGQGLYAEAMSVWTIARARPAALLVGFTNIASQSAAETLARRLLKLIVA